MKTLIVTFFLAFASISLCAQTGGSIMDKIDPNFLNSSLLYDEGTYSSFDGNPYLFETARDACVLLIDGRELCDVKVNYDAFEDMVLLRDKSRLEGTKDGLDYISPQYIDSFTAYGFTYKKSKIKGLEHKGFYQEIYEGETFSLYRMKDVKLRHRDGQGDSGYTSSNKKLKYFEISESYVLVADNMLLVESSLKRLLKSHDEFDYGDIKKYAKSNNIDMGNDVGIAKLMKYLDKN